MKTLGRHITLVCLLVLALAACNKPEIPNGGNTPQDTIVPPQPDTLVKKYLVTEYLDGDTIVPMRVIDWNEDFTRINRITTFLGGGSYCQIDHDFEYYGDDSICIIVSQPPQQWNWPLFTRCNCYLEEGKIVKAEYYVNSDHQSTDYFEYDNSGKLVIKRNVFESSIIEFQYFWDGENVSKIVNVTTGEIVEIFEDFCEHIYPDYTLPYLLPNGDGGWLMRPLWKNACNTSDGCWHECDSDGYIIRSFRTDENGNEIPVRRYVYGEKRQ